MVKSLKHLNVSTGNSSGIYNADVEPRRSIRIYGVQTNHAKGPVAFDRTFRIGEHDLEY